MKTLFTAAEVVELLSAAANLASRRPARKPPAVPERLLKMSDMAKLVGLRYDRFRKLVAAGRLPAPNVPKGRRHLYRPEDVEKVKAAFASHKPADFWGEMRARGLYTARDVARACGMPLVTFTLWQSKKWLPRATRPTPGGRYKLFNAADMSAIRLMVVAKRKTLASNKPTRAKG